jgi:hypothetical protein
MKGWTYQASEIVIKIIPSHFTFDGIPVIFFGALLSFASDALPNPACEWQ